MMINWTIREIEVFLSLADTLSFRRTAERMHLSQPAVSGVVARLEAGFGAALFERSTRAVRLTDAGQALLVHARGLQAQAGAAAAAVRDVAELRQGRVRVAALPSLAATVVPAVFARFAAEHPGVRLDLLDTLSVASFELVRSGEVDFALTAENPAYADLSYVALASDPFVLLLSARHPLARSRAPLTWRRVAELPHISMPAPTSVRQYADAALLQLGQRFEPRYEVEHLASINAMVAAGLGVSALPELAARVARGADVVQRRLIEPEVQRPIGLVTLQGRRLSTAAQALAGLLRDEVLRTLRQSGRGRGAAV
ncbi:LysR family transcriptional regulator [Ideonella sp. 4Y16]|uniref:LysR family transcriptional regulator n=1 Tax=Ideonella alba TaxID=2824118 RepID=A0A940YFE9_9BURK|nr:LysR family transcriptional regulator [Ideonella alba]MBQ0932276.1 LysR family transcriptional regulator [Ideonella alba]MBQ0944426.1 LysR family transcriptional regulator [Ideonella alba]